MMKGTAILGCLVAAFWSASPACAAETAKVPQQTTPQPPAAVPATRPAFKPLPRVLQRRSGALSCPRVTSTPVTLPPPVYDMARGDCALIGKSAEIEAFLRALEETAARCHTRQESNWRKLQEDKARLDREIDALPPAEPTGGSMRAGMPAAPAAEPLDSDMREDWQYTNWLRSMREDTAKYCQMVDELPEMLANTCSDINLNIADYGGGATDIQKTIYHQWLARDLDATRRYRYDSATRYYTYTLQNYSFGNFRRYFREENIRCGEGSGVTPIPPRYETLPLRKQ